MTTPFDLDAIELEAFDHESRENGVCLLEAVAWWAGEPHSARPKCVSNYLVGFGVRLNDGLLHEQRQLLKTFIPRLPGTAAKSNDESRRLMALNYSIHDYIPTWLTLAGLHREADSLRTTAPVALADSGEDVADLMQSIADSILDHPEHDPILWNKWEDAASDAEPDGIGPALQVHLWIDGLASTRPASVHAELQFMTNKLLWDSQVFAYGRAAEADLKSTLIAAQVPGIELYGRMIDL